MPIINATTGGYSVTLVLSDNDLDRMKSLNDGETVQLDDPDFISASRNDDLIIVLERNGRTYDVSYYSILVL